MSPDFLHRGLVQGSELLDFTSLSKLHSLIFCTCDRALNTSHSTTTCSSDYLQSDQVVARDSSFQQGNSRFQLLSAGQGTKQLTARNHLICVFYQPTNIPSPQGGK